MIFLFIFISLAAVMAAIYYRERLRTMSELYIQLRVDVAISKDIETVKTLDNQRLNDLAIKEITKW